MKAWLLLLTLGLAGCTTVPDPLPEQPDPNWGEELAAMDCVTVAWEARHPETGFLLGNGTAFFTIGLNFSNLGPDVEEALVGRHVNETFTVLGTNETGRVRTEDFRMDRRFGPYGIEQWWTREFFFENNPFFNLSNAEGGEFIHVHPNYDGEYREHNATHVKIAFTPTEEQKRSTLRNLYGNPYPMQLWYVEDQEAGTWEEVYVPTEPQWFEIAAAPDYSCWSDFLLTPGNYRVLEASHNQLKLEAHPQHHLPGELEFTLTVLEKHDLGW